MDKLPTTASFLISEDCNLACKYCFELIRRNKKSMSKEIAIEAINFLYKNAVENLKEFPDSSVNVTMFGGEPLLRPEILNEIVVAATELMYGTNIPFHFSIVTNGTIINDKIIKAFKNYLDNGINFGIQLSVDSIKELNDRNRITRTGKGSFDLVDKNIPKFKEIYGGEDFIFTDKRPNLHVHGSLNDDTIYKMYESYLFFRDEWRIPAIWFMPIHGDFWKPEHAEVYKEQLTLIAEDIKQKIRETGDIVWLRDYSPLDKALEEDFPGFPVPCGAGRTYCTVTASGDIYPCHQFYFNDANTVSKTGTIWEGIDPEKNALLHNYVPDDMYCTIDKDCDVYNCYRCVADYYQQTGSVLATHYDSRCTMSKYERDIINDMRDFINDFENHDKQRKEIDLEKPRIDTFFSKINLSGDI